MGYEQVDPVITMWVQRHSLNLHSSFADEECRSVYLSSANGECFQIWIDPVSQGKVCLHAADIETRNDQEMRKDWTVGVADLENALEEAVQKVRCWMER